jgi:hypothetical protein
MKPEIDFEKEERNIKLIALAGFCIAAVLGILLVLKYAEIIDNLLP